MQPYHMTELMNALVQDRERDTLAFLRGQDGRKARAAEDGGTAPAGARHRVPRFGLRGARHAGAGPVHMAGGHR